MERPNITNLSPAALAGLVALEAIAAGSGIGVHHDEEHGPADRPTAPCWNCGGSRVRCCEYAAVA